MAAPSLSYGEPLAEVSCVGADYDEEEDFVFVPATDLLRR